MGFAASACTVSGTSVALTGLGTCTHRHAGGRRQPQRCRAGRAQLSRSPPTHSAQVNLTRTVSDGSTVKLAPNTISTGGLPFDWGATVTLTAQPGTAQTFVRWTVDRSTAGHRPSRRRDGAPPTRWTRASPVRRRSPMPECARRLRGDRRADRSGRSRVAATASTGRAIVSRAQMAALIACATSPTLQKRVLTNGTLGFRCVAGSWDCEDQYDFDRGGLVAGLGNARRCALRGGDGYDGIHRRE
ncbi:MAG: hypothetical protein U0232_20845 [Thermomicrobiales bacterium]